MNKRDLRPILLVEDSREDAEMIMDALAEAHLANPIVHVEDGVDCMDYLQGSGTWIGSVRADPVVVLLDIKMPRMDGLEVLKRMRQDEHLHHIPVVILSSSREESDLARGWDLGVNAYVIKPVDVEQFFAAVRALGRFWAVFNQPVDSD